MTTDGRRFEAPWKCPATACKFTTTWAPARAKHLAAHERAGSSPPSQSPAAPLEAPRATASLPPRTSSSSGPSAQPATRPPKHHAPQEAPKRTPRELSQAAEDRMTELARREADSMVSARTRRLLEPFGIVGLTGKLEIRKTTAGITVAIDSSDVATYLAGKLADGARVRLLVLDEALLEGGGPQVPPRGQRSAVYGLLDEREHRGGMSTFNDDGRLEREPTVQERRRVARGADS